MNFVETWDALYGYTYHFQIPAHWFVANMHVKKDILFQCTLRNCWFKDSLVTRAVKFLWWMDRRLSPISNENEENVLRKKIKLYRVKPVLCQCYFICVWIETYNSTFISVLCRKQTKLSLVNRDNSADFSVICGNLLTFSHSSRPPGEVEIFYVKSLTNIQHEDLSHTGVETFI